MEADLLLWVHSLSSPALDAGARIGWALGVFRYLRSGRPPGDRLAPRPCASAVRPLAWLAVGVGAAVLPELLKALVARPRPTLWPWLIPTSGYSFPSGHAVAGAALYPLLGWLVLRSRGRGPAGYLLGLAVGVFIGLGRALRRRSLAERRPRRVGPRRRAEPRCRPLALPEPRQPDSP